jgi:hypothetical protein
MMKTALRIAIAATLALAIFPVGASAHATISEFSVGSSTQQAGGHPDLTARLKIAEPGQPEVVSNVDINLPEGLFGNPGAIFRCRAAVFVANECQPGAQAGLITIIANYEGDPNFVLGTTPIYNMQVLGDEAARMAFVVPIVNVPVIMPINVRSDTDYGLQISINSISQSVALSSALMNIWGFPGDKEHDPERFRPGQPGSPPSCPASLVVNCTEAPFPHSGETVRPLIDNPSVCSQQPLTISLDVTTYQDPTPAHAESTYPATENCESQKFDPLLQAKLTTPEADAPAGLDLELEAEQFLAGKAPSQSTLRTATLTMPEGVSINPDAADGQTSCTEAQARFGENLPGNCPDNAKIGTVEVHTPALEGPLLGSLYIGRPLPGNQYRVFMIFDGHGIHAKLVAEVRPDPVTGQITISVEDIPQVPFEEFDLHLFASDRGLMATPTHCRIYAADSNFVPWNTSLAPQPSSASLAISEGPQGRPCPGQLRPFKPRLVAGTSNALAGKYSSFTLKLDRDDGDQFLSDVNFRMPPGFTGSLRGLSYCPEDGIRAAAGKSGREEIAMPSCPASSLVGSTNVAAGPGSHPFHAVGQMYLAGPLNGAPISLVAMTPALAGPYDYGVVIVRVALHVDPQTAQVSAISDPMPQIIGGIPIRMRSIQVNIDKPNFTINPTNCEPLSVDSQGIGDQGTITDFSSYFQVVNCETLPFKPKMTIRQVGRKGTRRGANPQVRFDLRTRSGDANIKALSVTLPSAFGIDQSHLGNICSEKELAENQCAGRTPIGRASTTTPLLDKPLEGPVFAVSGSGGLPKLAFLLNGQVDLLPRAESKSIIKGGTGRLRTTVPVVPDAPIGHFELTIFGGKSGYLSNTRDICQQSPIVAVAFKGQNGRSASQQVRVKASCGKKGKARSKRHGRR